MNHIDRQYDTPCSLCGRNVHLSSRWDAFRKYDGFTLCQKCAMEHNKQKAS